MDPKKQIFSLKANIFRNDIKNKNGLTAKTNVEICNSSLSKDSLERIDQQYEFDKSIALVHGIPTYTNDPSIFAAICKDFQLNVDRKQINIKNIYDVELILKDIITSNRMGMPQNNFEILDQHLMLFLSYPLFYYIPKNIKLDLVKRKIFTNNEINEFIDGNLDRLEKRIIITLNKYVKCTKPFQTNRIILKNKLQKIEIQNKNLTEHTYQIGNQS